jgi:YVTN family beta-propeller protein
MAVALSVPPIGPGVLGSASASAQPRPATSVGGVRDTVGRAAVVPGGAARLGPAPATTSLHLDVVLKPRDPSALAALAAAVDTPGSPDYRRFLPRGQLTRDFGPSAATVASVRSALSEAGLSPGPVSSDGLIIPVTTTVGRAEAGLHTRIASYQLVSDRSAVANTNAPSLPAAVAPAVQAIIGLDTTTGAEPEALSAPAARPRRPGASIVTDLQPGSGPAPCYAASRTAMSFDSYTADEIAQAYGFDSLYSAGELGAGATVALFELEPYQANDISTFQSCYGTSTSVTAIAVDGGAGTGAGSGEAALDIENVIELAPDAHIQVYEAPNTDKGVIDDYAKIASNDTAQVVSTSWGLCEAFNQDSMAAETTIFEEMAAQGQTVFAASGDSGSEDCLPKNGPYTISSGTNPVAVTADATTGTMYVADQGSGGVTVESEAQFSPVLNVPTGRNPDALALDPVTHDVYVADGTSPGSVTVIPGATCNAVTTDGCATTTISGLGSEPAGIAVDDADGTLYVADEGSGTLSVISETSGTVVGTVALGSNTSPVGVAVDSASHDVYVTEAASDTVAVIDIATCDAAVQTGCGKPVATIAVGADPNGVLVDPATDDVYVADTASSDVSVIDATTGTVTATTSLQIEPVALALGPDGGQILVTGSGTDDQDYGGRNAGRKGGAGKSGTAGTVVVISTASDAVTTFMTTGPGPEGIAVDPVTGYAYVADSTATNLEGGVAIIPLFLAVDDPGSQPDVTDVGGTDLTGWASGAVESAWGDPLDANLDEPVGAGGGGISSVFPMPSYQDGVVGAASSGAPCGAAPGDDCREVPDVSASADPENGYVVYYKGGWTAFGGTSGAAPLWAALAALAVTLNGTVQPLGNINPDLYQFAADGDPDFNDVTSGDNDFTTTNGGAYAAGVGYDMATGLGSPQAFALATDLNPLVVTSEPVSEMVAAGQTATFTVGANGTPTPTVQWQVSTDGGATFAIVPDATADTYSFTATAADNGDQYEAVVTNSASSFTTRAATLQVFSITTSSLPEAKPGSGYEVQLTASGGKSPYAWTWSGSLPKGIKMTTAGLVWGTPAKRLGPGTYTLAVTASTRKTKAVPSVTASQTLILTLL